VVTAAFALDPSRDDRPREDQFVVLHDVSWEDLELVLAMRGERSTPRICYLEGELELMTPSRSHDGIKSVIGRLVEVFCLERGIEFRALGSWTLKDRASERAVEPDECYILGERDDDRPHLAIEVIWTWGGMDKLEVYRQLGVREVWTWRKGAIRVDVLRGDKYEEVASSEVLPGIDLALLVSFLDRPTTSAAIRGYRDALRGE
jgi:Uma2 family endonuclease